MVAAQPPVLPNAAPVAAFQVGFDGSAEVKHVAVGLPGAGVPAEAGARIRTEVSNAGGDTLGLYLGVTQSEGCGDAGSSQLPSGSQFKDMPGGTWTAQGVPSVWGEADIGGLPVVSTDGPFKQLCVWSVCEQAGGAGCTANATVTVLKPLALDCEAGSNALAVSAVMTSPFEYTKDMYSCSRSVAGQDPAPVVTTLPDVDITAVCADAYLCVRASPSPTPTPAVTPSTTPSPSVSPSNAPPPPSLSPRAYAAAPLPDNTRGLGITLTLVALFLAVPMVVVGVACCRGGGKQEGSQRLMEGGEQQAPQPTAAAPTLPASSSTAYGT